jgi:hypothetical protein
MADILSQFIRRNVHPASDVLVAQRGSAAVGNCRHCRVLHAVRRGTGQRGLSDLGTLQAGGLIVARLYGHLLQKRLGAAGVKTYLANPLWRTVGIVLTFELQALAVAAVV